MEQINSIISRELNIPLSGVKSVIRLFNEGATIPFISRYRKEQTGSLDEVQIAAIQDKFKRLEDLLKRRESVIKSIDEQGKLDAELRNKIEACWDIHELEDIYLPYKPRRKTRADAARESGLEPLAKMIMSQSGRDPVSLARTFVSKSKGVESIEAALQGARDIIAEWVNERVQVRQSLRTLFGRKALLTAKLMKGKEEEGQKYRDYFSFEQLLNKVPSHRFLAIMRASSEKILKVKVSPASEDALYLLERIIIKGSGDDSKQVEMAISDAWKRLLQPSLENESLKLAKEKADEEAIRVFAANLSQLLLAAPLGPNNVLAIDPGFRTGCKIVCLNTQGDLKHNETIYPHPPRNEATMAMKKIRSLVNAFRIEAIAIGNGTAGRETEDIISRIRFEKDVKVFVVSEAGASIYSASDVAREEFPEWDVTVRGAISIGRRLMDPLAELVKIDPKAIGVGQYQHDVDQNLLKERLDQVVESAVNRVGVNLNTASKHLLAYVSGLGPGIAANIVEWRADNGAFRSRKQLLKVPRLGPKAYEQAAGFLRIPDADNPLDNSAVHPESYKVVEAMAADLKCSVKELIDRKSLQNSLVPEKFISKETGLPTIMDILSELEKPGRDPREQAKVLEFDSGVRTIDDLREGMVLNGLVTNVTNFGAFVDIGIKENGLVHISNLRNEFTSDPSSVVSLHQHVRVKVISIDIERKRIQLSMKDLS